MVKTPRLRSLEGPELVRLLLDSVLAVTMGPPSKVALRMSPLAGFRQNPGGALPSKTHFWFHPPVAVARTMDLYLRMLRRECQRDPCRRRGGRSRTGAACHPVARLEIPRPGFSRAAAWPIAARMPGVCSVLDAQKTLSDELCG